MMPPAPEYRTRPCWRGYLVFAEGPDSGRRVHVVIAERKIGRRLLPNEEVHHLDLSKTNNDPDNLDVMTRAAHRRLHAALRPPPPRGARGYFVSTRGATP